MDENKQNSIFDKIIKDADIPKVCKIEYKGEDIEIKYKELLGDEAIEIEKKYGNDFITIILEQAYTMLVKANNGSENDMTREIWSSLPNKFRTKITMQINMEEKKDAEVFQSLQEAQEGSS